MRKFLATAASACLVSSSLLVTPAFSQSSASRKMDQKQSEIPTCGRKIGSLAIREPDTRWWEGLGLESPEALLKVFVMKSGCFTLVDRGKAFEMAQQERALAAGGTLQGGANVGGGQVRRTLHLHHHLASAPLRPLAECWPSCIAPPVRLTDA